MYHYRTQPTPSQQMTYAHTLVDVYFYIALLQCAGGSFADK